MIMSTQQIREVIRNLITLKHRLTLYFIVEFYYLLYYSFLLYNRIKQNIYSMDFDSENISNCQQGHQNDEFNQAISDQNHFRLQRLKNSRKYLQSQTSGRIRQQQSTLLYFCNLTLPISLSYLNAYTLLNLGVNAQLNGKLIILSVGSGLIISIYSNLKIAPWRQILRLYFYLDSMIPVIISGNIGFFSILVYNFSGFWYQYCYGFCFPLWVFYYTGSLRVMIVYLNWARWKVVLYKLVLLSCGLVFFYVGFTYMKEGAYKITEGYLVSVEDTFKNIVYLYVFGFVQLFFQYFRMLSKLDQTKHLRYQYKFQDETVYLSQILSNIQLQKLQREVIHEGVKEVNIENMVQSYKMTFLKFTGRAAEIQV